LAEFMRGLFPDAQRRDHEAYGALLAGVVGPTTGVFQRGETGAPTREIGPFHDTEDLPVGMIIAERYRIEQELGRGGMGTVYLAEHVTVGRKVAVKVLTREWSTHETVAKRFREEARAASAAGHPNIIEVFDAGTLPDRRLYLVMEYLDGRSLYDELCVTGPMPVDRALGIFRDIARGIAAAHAVGIIHRDLKPDNVMLVRRGGEIVIKLLDFGIAASADRVAEDRRLTQPGHTLGTPEYMAPEQAKGRPPTELVDIYALGAMLYEMLVGQPPFVGENYVEVLTRKATEVAPRIEQRRFDLPDHVVWLCHACLEIDPSRRPPNVAAVLQVIEDGPTTALVPVGGPAPVRIEGPRIEGRVEQLAVIRAPRAVEVPPRRASVIAAVASVVVVLLAGVGVWQLAASRGALGDGVGDDAGISEARLVASQGDGAVDTGDVAAPVEPRVEPPVVEPRVEPPVVEPRVEAPVVVEPPGTIDPPIAKPEPARPPAVDSPACREHRDAAVKAKRSSNWSAVLEHVSAKACWTGPHKSAAVALRVRALFQTGRFAECVKAGAKSDEKAVQDVAGTCANRMRDG
jgi:serine/threonine-protein kinase